MPIDDNTPLDSVVPSESKYLAKEDVGSGKDLTISATPFTREEVGQENEVKTILHFTTGKPMVLNKTNLMLLKIALDADTVGLIKNKTICCFNDPTVGYAGKIMGGIRIRAAAAPVPAPGVATAGSRVGNDDVPF